MRAKERARIAITLAQCGFTDLWLLGWVQREIDRAARKARSEERAKHCTCQTHVKCEYCDRRRKGAGR